MKNKLLSIITFLSLLIPAIGLAQTFTMTADTIKATINNTELVYNDVIVPGTNPVTVYWTVASTNFPADWLTNTALGICDGNTCRNNLHDTLLWNIATSTPGTTFSCSYNPGATNTFDYSPNLTNVTTQGCYFLTVALKDGVPLGTSKTVTFEICHGATGVQPIKTASDKIDIYPNPANNELNVVYDANAGIKTISIYNIIGKMMNVYKVTENNSANLDISALPSGVYIIKLYNANGNAMMTKKFTKQ